MTDKEILERVIELLEDLQWEVDRMSRCGVKTVEQLEDYAEELLNRIRKNSNARQ